MGISKSLGKYTAWYFLSSLPYYRIFRGIGIHCCQSNYCWLDECYLLFVNWLMNNLYLVICQFACFVLMLCGKDDISYNYYCVWWVFITHVAQAISLERSFVYYCFFYNKHYLHTVVWNCYMFWCCTIKLFSVFLSFHDV